MHWTAPRSSVQAQIVITWHESVDFISENWDMPRKQLLREGDTNNIIKHWSQTKSWLKQTLDQGSLVSLLSFSWGSSSLFFVHSLCLSGISTSLSLLFLIVCSFFISSHSHLFVLSRVSSLYSISLPVLSLPYVSTPLSLPPVPPSPSISVSLVPLLVFLMSLSRVSPSHLCLVYLLSLTLSHSNTVHISLLSANSLPCLNIIFLLSLPCLWSLLVLLFSFPSHVPPRIIPSPFPSSVSLSLSPTLSPSPPSPLSLSHPLSFPTLPLPSPLYLSLSHLPTLFTSLPCFFRSSPHLFITTLHNSQSNTARVSCSYSSITTWQLSSPWSSNTFMMSSRLVRLPVSPDASSSCRSASIIFSETKTITSERCRLKNGLCRSRAPPPSTATGKNHQFVFLRLAVESRINNKPVPRPAEVHLSVW